MKKEMYSSEVTLLRDTFRIEDIAERSSAVQNFVGLKEKFHSNMFES